MRRGQILIQALILSALALGLITILMSIALTNLGRLSRSVFSEQAFEAAEAGIEYYRWHLAHAPQDFQNGTGGPGPYTIPYLDKNGVAIGSFTLDITPPAAGSTVVTIRSTGRVTADPGAVRKIEVKFAYPSLAQYAVLSNDNLRFDSGTEVFGAVHSNGGVQFNGLAHNIVSSAHATYRDPDHPGGDEFGVHTHIPPIDPFPPAPVPQRLDVFEAGRKFPVPAIDFNGITANLAQIKADAQATGRYFAPSGAFGYKIMLRTNDTFDIYRVTELIPKPQGCSNVIADNDWEIWSVKTAVFIGNYTFPQNGLIFTEDHAWVEGRIDTARITIAAAKFPDNPSRRKSIIVNNDLTYTNYDGRDVIGLIAQNDINVGLYSEDDLRIDAAMVAKNGRVGRFYYAAPNGQNRLCGTEATRTLITVEGMIATNERYGFSWSCSGVYCSGYASRVIVYDKHLLFNPPPSFPVLSDEYQLISWEEVQ